MRLQERLLLGNAPSIASQTQCLLVYKSQRFSDDQRANLGDCVPEVLIFSRERSGSVVNSFRYPLIAFRNRRLLVSKTQYSPDGLCTNITGGVPAIFAISPEPATACFSEWEKVGFSEWSARTCMMLGAARRLQLLEPMFF